MLATSKVSPLRRQEAEKDLYKLIIQAQHCILPDADDHVWPQRQLEQLLPRTGAADSLHGAEAGWA